MLPRQAEPDLGRECLRVGAEVIRQYAREPIVAGRGPHGHSSIFIPDEALWSCGWVLRMQA